MALKSIQNTISNQRRTQRFIRSKFSVEPNYSIILKDEDDVKNYQNNRFIDSIFEDENSSKKPVYIEKVVSYSKLNTSSIKISKLIRVDDIRDKENKPKRVNKRACVIKTNEKIKTYSNYLSDKLSVFEFKNDDVSDNDLMEMVSRKKYKPKQSDNKSKTTRSKSAKQKEIERIREQEEREIREAAREYQQIKNYELVVETVQNDY